MKNKHGYALIYVLGIIALITFLVATLTNFTMQRVMNVNRNIYSAIEVAEAEMALSSASMELKDFFILEMAKNQEIEKLSQKLESYDEALQAIGEKYNVSITPDFTSFNEIKRSARYTLKFNANKLNATRELFISDVPSFLHFAVGSKADVSLNGGIYIDGNVYAGKNIYLSNQVNYVHNEKLYWIESDKVEFLNNSNLYVENSIQSCQLINDDPLNLCYKVDVENSQFNKQNFNLVNDSNVYNQSFKGESPTALNYNPMFLDVNIKDSFKYYLRETVSNSNPESSTYINGLPITDLIPEIAINNWLPTHVRDTQVPIHTSIANFIADESEKSNSIFFNEDVIFTKTNEIIFNKSNNSNQSKWIIVNGNLTIDNKNVLPLNISANLLVTGNVNLTGNIHINSIIYTLSGELNQPELGETLIDSATIRSFENNQNSLDSNQFILFSMGNIRFSKINFFNNSFNSFSLNKATGEYVLKPDIEGFFYTDANAEVFAVSSYIVLRGGIFAKGSSSLNSKIPYSNDVEGIILHAYRGMVNEVGNDVAFDFLSNSNTDHSRLVIQHSQQLLNEQPEGLPLNNKFNYIFGDIIIK